MPQQEQAIKRDYRGRSRISSKEIRQGTGIGAGTGLVQGINS